jgi:hypothetical protein
MVGGLILAGVAQAEEDAKPAARLKRASSESPAHASPSAHPDFKTNALPLTAELRQELIPGFSPVTRVIASAGTNQFAFLAPRGFRVDASDPKRIALIFTNETSFVTIRLLPPLPVSPEGKPNSSVRSICKKILLSEQVGQAVTSEFSRGVDGYDGVGFNVRWAAPGFPIQSVRVVFVPTPAGLLEFRLKTSPNAFRDLSYKFNNVLLSFRSSLHGDLEIVPLSNKF